MIFSGSDVEEDNKTERPVDIAQCKTRKMQTFSRRNAAGGSLTGTIIIQNKALVRRRLNACEPVAVAQAENRTLNRLDD
jgi:hypothetical protein